MTSPFPNLSDQQQAEEKEKQSAATMEERELLSTLLGYYQEAKEAREQGPSARDLVWDMNWCAYWGYFDDSLKAEWQSNNQMPEVPVFVERFSAAIVQALKEAGQWFTIDDPAKLMPQLMPSIERFVKVLLDQCGRNHTDHRVGFGNPFGDAVKTGTIMMCALSVGWEDGALKIAAVDPRELYYDPTGRNLYRIRRFEVDHYKLDEWAEMREIMEDGSEGSFLYDKEAIGRLSGIGNVGDDETLRKERAVGHIIESKGTRRPAEILEFYATILDVNGVKRGDKELCVVADQKEIIRGPEANPFWHGRDWIVAAPIINVPFSAYGRSYVEFFRPIADAFTEITNLLQDGMFTNAMNAFMAWPARMKNPNQLQDGVSPNKVFWADDEDLDSDKPFIQALQLGNPQAIRETVAFWQGVKSELREGGMQNELTLGQIPPKGEITATEIVESKSGTNAMTFNVSGNIENDVLAPVLELSYWTGLQFLDPNDPQMRDELGSEIVDMLASQKEDFRGRRWRFRAHGITSIMERGRKVRDILNFFTVAGSNQMLMQAVLNRFSADRILDLLMRLFGIDPADVEKTREEKILDQNRTMPPPGSGQQGGSPPAPRGIVSPAGGET